MFIKVTRSKNFKYLQLVESYRQGSKTKHKVIANLGRLDLLMADDQLAKIGNRMLQIAGARGQGISTDDIEEVARLYYGHDVYKKLWDKLNVSGILGKRSQSSKRQFDFVNTVFYLVINRLMCPASKKQSYESKDKYLDLKKPKNLQHIYRSLDILCDHKNEIEQSLFESQRHLFNMDIDVVFYDVTTFHFESVIADELRDFGFSKAGKFNEVQVLMGLLINKEGHPIGYELFEGNTFEGKTLVAALEKIKTRFSIDRIIIVADKGMNSKSNLHHIKQAGFDYIVASRLRSVSSKVQKHVLDKSTHHHRIDKTTGEIIYSHKSLANEMVFEQKDENNKLLKTHKWQDHIILSWSKQRAELDRKKRQRLIQRAENMLTDRQTNITKRNGAARYLKIDQKATAIDMDWDKVAKDAQWDGYYAVQYSGTELSHDQVMEQYHKLWKIEESFRVLKTTMKTRPIFHWTPRRIKGHFMLCFIAFVIERCLEIKLKNNHITASPEKIKDAINSLQVSKIKSAGAYYYLKGKNDSLAAKILRVLKINTRPNLDPVNVK